MDSFPPDFQHALTKGADQWRREKRLEWLAKRRRVIFQGLVRATVDDHTVYSYLFEPGRELWDLELCQELVTHQQPATGGGPIVRVQVFQRNRLFRDSAVADVEIPYHQWSFMLSAPSDELLKGKVLYAKIKLR